MHSFDIIYKNGCINVMLPVNRTIQKANQWAELLSQSCKLAQLLTTTVIYGGLIYCLHRVNLIRSCSTDVYSICFIKFKVIAVQTTCGSYSAHKRPFVQIYVQLYLTPGFKVAPLFLRAAVIRQMQGYTIRKCQLFTRSQRSGAHFELVFFSSHCPLTL